MRFWPLSVYDPEKTMLVSALILWLLNAPAPFAFSVLVVAHTLSAEMLTPDPTHS